MKTTFLLTALTLIAFGTARAQTAKLLKLDPERIRRVEILYFNEQALVRAALGPETLERLYEYKLEIRDIHETAQWASLSSILRETSVEPAHQSHDYRTALLFFDEKGDRLASVYFDVFGKGGAINDDSGTMNGGLYRWGKSMLSGATK